MSRQHDTTFGREHGFAEIDCASDFRRGCRCRSSRRCGLTSSDSGEQADRALTSRGAALLRADQRNDGNPKHIPITPTMLAMHRGAGALLLPPVQGVPAAFDGMAWASWARRSRALDSGHSVGSVSGHLYASLPRFIQSRFVVPPAVSTIADYDLKYRIILHLALAQPRITYIGSPNPSTFLRLLHVLNIEREMLMRSLATAGVEPDAALDPSLQQSLVASRMPAMPDRAARLNKLPELTYANVWPDVKLLTTWTGGSCGIALGALRKTLPVHTLVMELATSRPKSRDDSARSGTAGGLPTPGAHRSSSSSSGQPGTVSDPSTSRVDQLEPGRRYYVLITTPAGLYRYFMNDLVEVTGFFRKTPLLRFVQKGKGVTSLTGEKLYEAQVIDAFKTSSRGAESVPPSSSWSRTMRRCRIDSG